MSGVPQPVSGITQAVSGVPPPVSTVPQAVSGVPPHKVVTPPPGDAISSVYFPENH